MELIRNHKDLKVYNLAFEATMEIFELSKSFPIEEKYSLTDQIRRSSRSVCANIAEAYRKRRYPKAFVSKLSDSEGEAAETQVWLDLSLKCKYITDKDHQTLYQKYDWIIGKILIMINNPDKWSV